MRKLFTVTMKFKKLKHFSNGMLLCVCFSNGLFGHSSYKVERVFSVCVVGIQPDKSLDKRLAFQTKPFIAFSLLLTLLICLLLTTFEK